MMRKPEFITFTGADNWTDVDAMVALHRDYPVEWGILFSPSRQDQDRRYPGETAQKRFCWRGGLRLAAHICGAYSRAIMTDALDCEFKVPSGFGRYDRVQINFVGPDPSRLRDLHEFARRPCILQSRSMTFPDDDTVDWLFDRSGGLWPPHPGGDRLVGYAGGIGPDNVADVLEQIGATGPYWIDMESGVRTDDRFDLGKCRRVCEAVYGP